MKDKKEESKQKPERMRDMTERSGWTEGQGNKEIEEKHEED